VRRLGVLPPIEPHTVAQVNRRGTMNKLKMLVLTALAAATVGTGALAAAPSASALPPIPIPKNVPCWLHTNLGNILYPHLSEITVIGSDHKYHRYVCNNGIWQEIKMLTTPTATYTGSLATVVTRV
jgi:hypothetical protein